MKKCRLLLDYGIWNYNLPEELKNDESLSFLAQMLLYFWEESFDELTFLSKQEVCQHTVPIMRNLHKELVEGLKEKAKSLSKAYQVEDDIETAIEELASGGEALFWDKEHKTPTFILPPA